MSSPRAAASARPGKTRAKPVPARAGKRANPTAKPPKPAAEPASAASAQATQLATTIERALAAGQPNVIAPQALQALTGALCKAYAARIEAGEQLLPIGTRSTVTPTEVMLVASGLLRAANLAVFELGMWQSWTGR